MSGSRDFARVWAICLAVLGGTATAQPPTPSGGPGEQLDTPTPRRRSTSKAPARAALAGAGRRERADRDPARAGRDRTLGDQFPCQVPRHRGQPRQGLRLDPEQLYRQHQRHAPERPKLQCLPQPPGQPLARQPDITSSSKSPPTRRLGQLRLPVRHLVRQRLAVLQGLRPIRSRFKPNSFAGVDLPQIYAEVHLPILTHSASTFAAADSTTPRASSRSWP